MKPFECPEALVFIYTEKVKRHKTTVEPQTPEARTLPSFFFFFLPRSLHTQDVKLPRALFPLAAGGDFDLI
jgi:hypothetical protein